MTDHIKNRTEDGLYYKYRVFKEPEDIDTHPVVMTAYFSRGTQTPTVNQSSDIIGYAKEVTDFIFPLKPDTDHHARVALAAYATSVSEEKPELAKDLFDVLRDMMEEVEEGIL